MLSIGTNYPSDDIHSFSPYLYIGGSGLSTFSGILPLLTMTLLEDSFCIREEQLLSVLAHEIAFFIMGSAMPCTFCQSAESGNAAMERIQMGGHE